MGHEINFVIENQGVSVSLDEVDDFGEGLVDQSSIVADAGDSERGALPFIKPIHFGNRDIETASDTIFDALDNPPLTLEGGIASQVQLDAARSNSHGR
jgi:hypothetical protein